MTFLGEYRHNIDQKGRMAVPAKFRNSLGTGAVVTRGIDACLFIFPKGEWDRFAKKLVNLPLSQKKARAFVRLMLSGASDVEFDKQGRILIPEHLRRYANLTKKTVVTGLYNRIEAWDESAWNKYRNATEKSSEEIAEQMGELGI